VKLGPLSVCERKIIGEPAAPLLVRYILFRLPWFGVYLHQFCQSDYDRALHDHPWPFVSVMLRGGYFEVHDHTPSGEQVQEWRAPGSVLLRPAEWRHRVILKDGVRPWTLILVGRRQRAWGFFLPDGWCWWRRHNPDKGICEEDVIWQGGSD
jgi:hypothetical protein